MKKHTWQLWGTFHMSKHTARWMRWLWRTSLTLQVRFLHQHLWEKIINIVFDIESYRNYMDFTGSYITKCLYLYKHLIISTSPNGNLVITIDYLLIMKTFYQKTPINQLHLQIVIAARKYFFAKIKTPAFSAFLLHLSWCRITENIIHKCY